MLFLLVILGFVGLYIGAQLARRKRMLRYANTELLESFAPQRPKHWRHRIRRVLRSTPAIACSRSSGARSQRRKLPVAMIAMSATAAVGTTTYLEILM